MLPVPNNGAVSPVVKYSKNWSGRYSSYTDAAAVHSGSIILCQVQAWNWVPSRGCHTKMQKLNYLPESMTDHPVGPVPSCK